MGLRLHRPRERLLRVADAVDPLRRAVGLEVQLHPATLGPVVDEAVRPAA